MSDQSRRGRSTGEGLDAGRALGAVVAAGVAYFVVAVAMLWLARRDAGIAEVWLPNAVMLGLILRRSGAAVPPYLAAVVMAAVTANLLMGLRPVLAAGFALANAVEIGVASWMVRRAGLDRASRPDDRVYFLGLLYCVGLGPFAGALTASLLSWLATGAAPATVFVPWWAADAMGMFLVVPLMLAWRGEVIRKLVLGDGARLFWIFIVATVAATLTLQLFLPRPFIVLTTLLLLGAYRVGILGTFLACVAMAVITIVLALLSDTLLPAPARGLAGLTLRQVNALIIAASFGPMLIAVVVSQRDAAARRVARVTGQLRTVTDNVPAVIAEVDPKGRYAFVNRRYEQWSGRKTGEVIGRTPAQVLGETTAAHLSSYITQALAGERLEFDLSMPDGTELQVHYEPQWKDGRPHGFFVLAHDVTERRRDQRELFESRERAEVMLNSIGDAVVACDDRLRVTLLNPIAEDMTGWTQDDALGRPIDEVLKLVNMEDGGTALSPLKTAIAQNRIVALQANCALRRRDGLESPIEDSAAPLHDRDGKVIGGIMVFHDVSESRAMALKMSHLAQHDYLTDLPNRVLLHDRLAQALASAKRGGNGALLFLDLDHFKTINDSLGHHVGDVVLQEVAKRLGEVVRSDDTVSRQGGDEFVVLLARLHDPRDVARVAEKMIDAIERPMEVEGHALQVSASIGIALFPQDATDIKSLMKHADVALYHAKGMGRGRFSYFTEEMSKQAQQRLQVEHQLRDAMSNGELFLVYQPKVSLPEGRITGMEALVRWRREDGSVVPPGEFIPIAEESGLVVQLDEWVMREACRQNVAWQRAGLPVLPVAVNLSLARFDGERLLAMVRTVLADTGMLAQCLEVEFTETQMFEKQADVREVIDALKAMGVGVAVDDFGTGYSNLSYLVQYRFDAIKIDRSFVEGLPADTKQYAIVQAIIGMARALGCRVVAEGVETVDQMRMLEMNDCHEMQGYLFSRPLEAKAFDALLSGRRPLHPMGGAAPAGAPVSTGTRLR